MWVTDLAADQTEEQIGPPYGFPVEFSHPEHALIGQPPTMLFTFLGSSAPPGVNVSSMQFYAWASVTRGGEVVAWDYAPDASWLSEPPVPPP